MKLPSSGPLSAAPVRWSRVFLYGFLMLLFLAMGAMLVELEIVGTPSARRYEATSGGASGAAGGASGASAAARAAEATNRALVEEVSALRAQLETAREQLGDAAQALPPVPAAASTAAVSTFSADGLFGGLDIAPRTPKDLAPMASKYSGYKRVVHVVSHTHWDREWYMAFEHYRRRFVWLLDDVMDRMTRFPDLFRHFHMDGQVIPFVDYFEVRPDRKADVLRAVREGKLSIGPWYTAPDEFLASPEALVRNIQNGLRHCRKMGVEDEWTRIGYMADTFGHVSQIPQIYRLFGIDNAVFARGVRNPRAEMVWEAPDGSSVFCVYMTSWYCNAEGSPASVQSGPSWLNQKANAVASKSSTKHVLLMSGCDHTSFDPNILQNMDAANKKGSKDALYVHSNLEHFVDTVQKAANAKSLPKHTGEMRAEIGHLSHINSNKITQKQANWECMTLLEHYAEPMRALLWARGAVEDYNSDYIWYAWEKILENHAHDSIGGCSITDVHKDVDHRFHRCVQVGRQMVDEALMALARHAEPGGAAGNGRDSGLVGVFNTLSHRRANEVFAVRVNMAARVGERPVVVDTETGKRVRAEVIYSEGSQWDYALPDHGFRKPMRVSRSWLAISSGDAGVPPLGYKVYRVESLTGGEGPERGGTAAPAAGGLGGLENEHLRATVRPDGQLDIECKKTGEKYTGLAKLVLQDDRGDEYRSQPGGSRVAGADKVKLGKCVKGAAGERCTVDMTVPAPGAGMKASVMYMLPAGSRAVHVRVSVLNHNDNFRMRAHFNPAAPGGISEADQHFDVVQRGLASPGEERAQQDFVTLRTPDGKRGLTVGNKGLPGYEIEGGAIAVTLLRAVSKMSDWATFPTSPSSQEHGKQHFELTVAPFVAPAGGADAAAAPGSHADAHAFNVPLAAVHMLTYPGVMNSQPLFNLRNSLLRMVELDMAGGSPTVTGMPAKPTGGGGGGSITYSGAKDPKIKPFASLVSVEPSAELTVTSVKVSEPRDYTKADGGTVIVRWFNHGSAPADARVCFDLDVVEAYEVNLREDRGARVAVSGGCLAPLKTTKRQIRTVELVVKRPDVRNN